MNHVDRYAERTSTGFGSVNNLGDPGLLLWWRQLWAVIGAAVEKSLLSKRVFVALVLIALPVAFLTVVGLVHGDEGLPLTRNINYARMIYGIVYSTFILGAVLYLGSALMFTSLLRGEILERSIHYLLLAPVRREILVIGKYLGGLFSAFVLFGAATIICYLLIYLPYGSTRLATDLSGGVALQQMATYTLMTLLGCMGYGSVFMAAGLLFRNPLIPVLAIAGWEFINFILPPALKLVSVIYYLKSLMPIFIDEGPLPLAVVAAPLSSWAAVLGIVLLSVGAVLISIVCLKRLEIKYTED